MTSFFRSTGPPVASLSERLGRLRRTFDSLPSQLHGGIASAIADAIAGALEQGLRTVFGTNQAPARWPSENQRWQPRTHRASWLEDDGSSWPDEDNEDDGDDWQQATPGQYRPIATPPVSSEPSRLRRWLSALAAGVRTAVWWLRCQAPRRPVITTLAVGLTAAVVALTAGATGLVGSVLGAWCVTDLARSSAAHMATP